MICVKSRLAFGIGSKLLAAKSPRDYVEMDVSIEGASASTIMGAGAQCRNAGIDMLRLVLMFFVVVLYTPQHGGVLPLAANGAVDLFAFTSPGKSVSLLLYCDCHCAVPCFVLVLGFVYFCAQYCYLNLVVIWLQMLFWSIVLTLAAVCQGDAAFDLHAIVHTIMPVSYSTWWFFQVYFLLFLVMLVLNVVMRAFSNIQAAVLLGYLLFQVPFCPRLSSGMWRSLICGLILVVALWGSCLVASWGVSCGIGWMRHIKIMSCSSPIALAIAVCFLVAFKDLKLRQVCIDVIEKLAPYVFGVYLVSEFWWVKSPYLGRLSRLADASSPQMALGFLGLSLCVFAVCLSPDVLKGLTFKRLKITDRVGKIEMRHPGAFGEMFRGGS